MLWQLQPNGVKWRNGDVRSHAVLGAKYDRTLDARKHRLKVRLRQKYQRVLRMPDWTPAELDELGPRLRQHVEAGLALRALARKRIAW